MTFKLEEINWSGNDEFYTPKYAVKPILKYIKKNSIVWCPFDTDESWFVKLLKREGYKVVHSHIKDKKDFFYYEPQNWDVIVSNPPYSIKNKVLDRCYELGKPFALLMGVVGVFEGNFRTKLFSDNGVEVLYLTPRIEYFEDYRDQKPSKYPPFQSAFFCNMMLPKQIMFEKVNKKDFYDEEQMNFFGELI